jgi:hypothetical protein
MLLGLITGFSFSMAVSRYDLRTANGFRQDAGELVAYCNLTYSAFACFRRGMSGSASFQRDKKS